MAAPKECSTQRPPQWLIAAEDWQRPECTFEDVDSNPAQLASRVHDWLIDTLQYIDGDEGQEWDQRTPQQAAAVDQRPGNTMRRTLSRRHTMQNLNAGVCTGPTCADEAQGADAAKLKRSKSHGANLQAAAGTLARYPSHQFASLGSSNSLVSLDTSSRGEAAAGRSLLLSGAMGSIRHRLQSFMLQDVFLLLLQFPVSLFLIVDLLAAALLPGQLCLMGLQLLVLSALWLATTLALQLWSISSISQWARDHRDAVWTARLVTYPVMLRLSFALLSRPQSSTLLQGLVQLAALWDVVGLKFDKFVGVFPYVTGTCYVAHMTALWPDLTASALLYWTVCYLLRPACVYALVRCLNWGALSAVSKLMSTNPGAFHELGAVATSCAVGLMVAMANAQDPGHLDPSDILRMVGSQSIPASVLGGSASPALAAQGSSSSSHEAGGMPLTAAVAVTGCFILVALVSSLSIWIMLPLLSCPDTLKIISGSETSYTYLSL